MADQETNLGITITARDQGEAIIRAFNREIDSLNSKLAQAASAMMRFGQANQAGIQATSRVIGEMTNQLRANIAVIEKQMTSMSDVIKTKNNEAIESIRRLATEQRALASVRPAEAVMATTGTGRRIGVAPTTSELIQRNVIGQEGEVLAQNIYYKNQDAIATAKMAEAERVAAQAANEHSAALRAENANIQARINAITGVSNGKAADDVFGTSTVSRRGKATGSRRTSAFGDIEGEESGGGGLLSGLIRPQEMRHVVGGIDELSRGQRGAFFSTLGAAARDAGLGVTALAGSMAGLVAIMASAAVVKGVENVGKLAIQVQAGAAATGMTVTQYSSVQGALELTGAKAGQADQSLRRLAKTTSDALGDPASKAAEAFHNLGVSQEDLQKAGNNTYNVLQLLAKALHEDEGGATTAQNAQAVLGAGSEKLLGILAKGPAEFDRLTQKAREMGLTFTEETAASAAETTEKLETLGKVISGDLQQAFIAWGPTVTGAIDVLTTLGGVLTKIITSIGIITNEAPNAGRALADLAANGKGNTPEAATALSGMVAGMDPIAAAMAGNAITGSIGLTSGGNQAGQTIPIPEGPKRVVPPLVTPASKGENDSLALAKARYESIQRGESTAQIAIRETTAAIGELNKKLADPSVQGGERVKLETQKYEQMTTLAREQASASTKAAHQSYEDFAAVEKLKIAEAGKDYAQIIQIYDEWDKAAQGIYHQNASVWQAIEAQKVKATQKAAAEIFKENLKAINEKGQETRTRDKQQQTGTEYGLLAGGASVSKLSGSTATVEAYRQDSLRAAQEAQQSIAAIQAAEAAALVQAGNDAQASATIRMDAEKQVAAITAQAEEQQIQDFKRASEAAKQAASELTKAFDNFFNKAGSQIDSFASAFIKAVVAPQQELIKAGLTTIKVNLRGEELRAAAQKLFTGLASDLVSSVTSGISKAAAQALATNVFKMTLSGDGGMSSLFSGLLGKALGATTSAPSAASFGIATTTFSTAVGAFSTAVAGMSAGGAAKDASSLASGAGGLANGAGAAANAAQPVTSALGQQTGMLSSIFSNVGNLISTTVTGSGQFIAEVIQAGNAVLEFLLSTISVKPEALGFSYSGGGIVSAAGGMSVGGIPGGGGQLAILHSREMVLPRHLSEGVQGAINSGSFGQGGRGNSANLNYNPTINMNGRASRGDRAQLNQMLSSHAGSFAGAARQLVRQGWRG